MALKVSVIIYTLFLVGCACKPEIITEYVKVPPMEPPIISKPALETDYLKAESDPGLVIQAHRITIKRLQQWGLELESALDAYRIKDTK